jgi:translation initiation factor 3 subunit E
MAAYDLSHTIGSFLDRHLVFPLLEFVQGKGIYPAEEVLKGKLELIKKTNMVDFAVDIYKALHHTTEVPPEMKEKREVVVAQLRKLQSECAPLLRVLENEELVKKLRAEKQFTLAYLHDNYEVKAENVDALYKYAKFQFDIGNYSVAGDQLYHFRSLSSNSDKNFSALWGKLAAEILNQNWEAALEDVTRLKDLIETRGLSPLVQLQQRTWLIHWSLFIFFNHPNGRNGIIDMFFTERYLNAIQTTCPHILRYLTAAVITNRRKKNVLKDLVKVIQQEGYKYRDPITEFVESLFVSFDFEGAQKKLRECGAVLMNDFFLVSCHDEFIENARLFIFETYCRIHQRIDIGMLAEKLNMDQESAERWIVNLIRNARLDAKIDSANNHVIMGSQHPSIYQQVIEKTKGLSFRSHVLSQNILTVANANPPPTPTPDTTPATTPALTTSS